MRETHAHPLPTYLPTSPQHHLVAATSSSPGACSRSPVGALKTLPATTPCAPPNQWTHVNIARHCYCARLYAGMRAHGRL